MQTLQLWINGRMEQAHSSRSAALFNPATGDFIQRVALADADDVARAVASAQAALPGWRATTPLRRARILTRFRELMEQHRDELAQLASNKIARGGIE